MKQLKLSLIFILSILLLSSCSSDDNGDDNISNNESIVGSWRFTKLESVVIKSNMEKYNKIIENYSVAGYMKDFGNGNQITTFTADGKFIEKYKDETYYGAYTYVNGILSVVYDNNEDNDNFSQKVSIQNGFLSIDSTLYGYAEELEHLSDTQYQELGIDPKDGKNIKIEQASAVFVYQKQ